MRSHRDQISTILNSEFEREQRTLPNYIFTQWRLFILLLRSIGSCPASIRITPSESSSSNSDSKRKKEKNILFQFKLFSWITLYSLVCNFLRAGLCILYYRDWGRIILGRRYGNSLEDWIIRSMNIAMPFYQIWDMVCVWLTIQKSVKCANNWIQFESNFFDTFGSHYGYHSTLQKYRRFLLLTACIPVCGVASVFVFDLVSLLGNENQSSVANYTKLRNSSSSPQLIPSTFYFVPVPFFIFTTILEEVKVLLMYRTLSEAYLNLRRGIQSEIQEGNLLTEEAISQWTKILTTIRRQAALTGQIQAPQQILVLIHTVIIFTESFFILMVHEMDKHIWLSVGLSSTYVMRILAKIMLAEQVTDEEQQLADELIEINPTKLDILAKLETKKIVDLILQKPMKISLANYVIIDKRMVPKIISYIVAYLVVLFQFHLGTDFKKSENIGTGC